MADFVKAAKKSNIPEGTGKTVDVSGNAVALFNVGGELCAVDNACPHRGGPLGEGDVAGSTVTCPWHGWQFDVKTGAAVTHAGVTLKKRAVKAEGDDILVEA